VMVFLPTLETSATRASFLMAAPRSYPQAMKIIAG